VGHQRHHAGQDEGEGRQSRAGAIAAEQDAQANAQERRDQQEVGKEADVPDVGRDPADEQQLDIQDGEAGQEEADVIARQETGDGLRATGE
jgi:hypothetical protein